MALIPGKKEKKKKMNINIDTAALEKDYEEVGVDSQGEECEEDDQDYQYTKRPQNSWGLFSEIV